MQLDFTRVTLLATKQVFNFPTCHKAIVSIPHLPRGKLGNEKLAMTYLAVFVLLFVLSSVAVLIFLLWQALVSQYFFLSAKQRRNRKVNDKNIAASIDMSIVHFIFLFLSLSFSEV